MQYSFASRTAAMLASPVRHIRENARRHSFISLAEELPAQELFPVKLLEEAAHDVFGSGPDALQYGEPEGYFPLRAWLAGEWEQRKGVRVPPGQILLTTGSQQAIDLIIRLMVDERDPVLVENPTSPGCLQVLSMQGAQIVPVESDGEGVIPDKLEALMIRYRPKLFFATPTFTNPTGSLWSAARRQEILDLCRHHEVLVVEDDSYGELHFKQKNEFHDKSPHGQSRKFAETYPSLFALDHAGQGGQVLYIGSFNKTVAPALRTGWAAGPAPLIEGMYALKQLADMQSSTMNQRLLFQLLTSSRFQWHEHLAMLNKEYSTRLQLILELLKRPFWKDVTYHIPSGGMYVWVQLPDGLDSALLLKAALPKGVAFMPGALCAVGSEGASHIRLNFSHPGREQLLMGMNLIGETISEFTARS
ncbi:MULTISPECIES: PLP-dependent aminotransferase family protein [Paenibacillus]|uniref:PLP-dependent aminotransferase family protein n=1 Tax=Paenibacillus peoriae TaxID=59893 RepID=A0A7H0YCN3_9BACL|nr:MULTISPECIES: PLP-dependent aminotransferase family protein [Paenibacillus]KOS01255.1 transcriptional regulator [Paenibacillus polymyxa]PNQ81740.1 PLP-dependent aminotransferase family protein [Paenibacillus sp. F4]QNR68841.1 PLP-dependent aminotransferase family protein [Paenibacillus peoriae]